jgi:hypothetical protein
MARRRSLSLRGLFIVLAILAAIAVAERVHIIPPGGKRFGLMTSDIDGESGFRPSRPTGRDGLVPAG